ncbi:MAG: hypothetical protein WEF86_06830 [Gemmatimonadota bacterium]
MRNACTTFMLAALAAAASSCGDRADDDAAVAGNTAVTDSSAITVADVGFATPESVLYDDAADLYLVSNINGEPLGRDDNGFISQVDPNGAVVQLKWIDGAADGITLHAPKGMGLRGDTLFIADIDSVRLFHRGTGEVLGARGVPNASFLNDIAVGDDGVYVTDTGVDASFAPTGSAAIYHFGADGPTAVATGDALQGPNGIATNRSDVLVVPFGGNTVMIVRPGAAPETVATLPTGQLDGIVYLDDGSLLVSSWEGSAVYLVGTDGVITTIVENIDSPADIGWDSRRRRVLIPSFTGNRIEIRGVDEPAGADGEQGAAR